MSEWAWDLCLLWSYFLVIIKRFGEIILPQTTWKIFIKKYLNIERLLQSTAPSALMILIVELIKIHDVNIVKLKSHDACLNMKSSTFELEHCINHMYFKLCQKTHCTSKKFKQFVILRQNCITNKCDAANIHAKFMIKIHL